MNAAGVRVERWAGRSIMSGLHGLWLVGVLAGSGRGVLRAHAQIGAPADSYSCLSASLRSADSETTIGAPLSRSADRR
jgi:hypothetical protein